MSAFVAHGNRVRIPVSILAVVALSAVACKRDVGSYNFDDASAEAQQAIAGNVDFTLTEDIFQKWEKAQANLEKMPSSVIDAVPDPGGSDPVARGIKRLEGSSSARQAIESAGLSVKTFVFATVALAQAVKASQGGVPPTVGAIATNVRFVLAHAGRLGGRGAASVWVPPSELSQEDMAAQQTMRMDSSDNSGDMKSSEMPQPVAPPAPPPPTRDSSGTIDPVPAPPKTDSLTETNLR